MRERRWGFGIIIVAAAIAGVTALTGVMPASSQAQIVEARAASNIPRTDPFAPFWDNVPSVDVALSTQNLTRPMGGGTVASIRVRAVHDDDRLYIVGEWGDSTEDLLVDQTTAFTDAAAVEFPASGVTRIPSFCMGDPQAGVNIWHWKGAWQSDIDTGFVTNRASYPNLLVDSYLEHDDPTFQTGLAAGNPVSQRSHASPVENLVAAQFGTLTHADVQDVGGVGRWRNGRWRVIFERALPGAEGEPTFAPGGTTNAAFAVWDGSQGQRDGIKSVSQFIDVRVSGERVSGKGGGTLAAGLLAFSLIMTLVAAMAIYGVYTQRRRSPDDTLP